MPRSLSVRHASSSGEPSFFVLAIGWLLVAASLGFLSQADDSSLLVRTLFFAAVGATALTIVLGLLRATRHRDAHPDDRPGGAGRRGPTGDR